MKDYIDKIYYKGEILFSPTYDPLFKGIFVSPDDYSLMASFLSSALKMDIRAEGIRVDNTELTKDNIKDKGVRLDLKVSLADGSIINVEMQVGNEYDMGKRSIYHLSRLMTGQVKTSTDYSDICPVIAINILDFNYIKDSEDFHNRYRMKNLKTGAEMPDAEVFEINFIELPKLPKDAGNDLFLLWLKFLSAKTEEDINMVLTQEPTIFGIAVNKLRKLSADEEIRERLRKEEKAEMDRISALNQREREGMKKGIKEGIKEGMKKGMTEGKREAAIKMKVEEFDDDVIARVTGLPLEEIKLLKRR